MTDPQSVGFKTATTTQLDLWRFTTPGGHAVTLQGGGLTYDSSGRAKTGTVTSVSFDLGNDGSPDVTITDVSAPATRFDDGPNNFWRVFEGNDVIHGPVVSQGASALPFTIAGDGVAARSGTAGGGDLIHANDGNVTAYGDVQWVGHPVAGQPTASYRGGNDQILGLEVARAQTLSGDADAVWAGSKLTGGHDTIFIQTTSGSTAVGDALRAVGSGGVLAQVVGGNDHITAGPNYRGTLVGDVYDQYAGSLVRGGADTIQGGELAEVIVGDVYRMRSSQLIGGNDTIDGNGGNDLIYGDAYIAEPNTTITGGDDVIRGGRGADTIYGDFGNGGLVTAGGDDHLYGGDGDDRLDGDSGDDVFNGDAGFDYLNGDEGGDRLYGGSEDDVLDGDSGNDLLDGGAGADTLQGGSGDDTYFVNDAGDKVVDVTGAGAGADTVWSFQPNYALGANIESLRFNGLGNFSGYGNGLDNTMAGSAGDDFLYGGDGDDTLIGAAGADRLQGGAGIDTASYASATAGGVYASLRGSANGAGDALGDTYADVENLAGSGFGDALFGDDRANTLSGGAGDDNLQGQLGDDVLIGGAGQDDLVGQGGNDTFVFNARTEGGDEIYGFSNVAGDDDRLQFEGDAFGGLPTGALSASRFVANTSGVATSTSQRFVYETDTGVLRFDANGSAAGGVTEIAALTNVPVLNASDFMIV